MEMKQFFKGVGKQKELLAWLEGDIDEMPLNKAEFIKLLNNSTEAFQNGTMEEFDKLNKESSENRLLLHWIVGNNTEEFLNMK